MPCVVGVEINDYICSAKDFKDSNNANYKSDKTFKEQSRQMVESTTVFTEHCFEVFCSDLLLLSYSNLYIMQKTKDECASGANQQRLPINLLLDDVDSVKNDLHEMFISYLVNNEGSTIRDLLEVQEFFFVGLLDNRASEAILFGMNNNMHYKDIYKYAKDEVNLLANSMKFKPRLNNAS